MALEGKKILITGGAGFIGTTLARRLVDANQVTAVDNLHRDALSGTDLAGFDAQLGTTRMFYTPSEAVAFAKSTDLVKTMELVRTFCFEHNLLGEGVKSKDAIGIVFPSGETLGRKNNVKLRFDASLMQMAADGKL